jgi:hypothetical protein
VIHTFLKLKIDYEHENDYEEQPMKPPKFGIEDP